MKMKFVPFLLFGLILLIQVVLFMPACTNDELPPPETPAFCDTLFATYNTNVKTIIDESCAYSGCHDGAGGIGPGNYENYGGILSILESNAFQSRVIDLIDDPVSGMPPNQSAYSESKKDDLTEEEYRILLCWLDAGYPEE